MLVVMWRGRHRSKEEEERAVIGPTRYRRALAVAATVAEGSMVSVIVEGWGGDGEVEIETSG